MSILIKNMEMPKNCEECFFLGTDSNAHWYCYCQKKKISITSEKAYDSGCPLIELPNDNIGMYRIVVEQMCHANKKLIRIREILDS